METSREFSPTPRRLPPCSDVSVLQKTRMSHFWDTHHSTFGLTYHFSCRLLGSECAQQALDFQRSEWTGFLAVSVRVKRMYA